MVYFDNFLHGINYYKEVNCVLQKYLEDNNVLKNHKRTGELFKSIGVRIFSDTFSDPLIEIEFDIPRFNYLY